MEVDDSIRTPIDTTKRILEKSIHFYDVEGLTVQKIFHSNAKKFANRKHYGVRPFDPVSKTYGEYKYFKFSEIEEFVRVFGSGLRTIGLNPKDRIGIMAKNCLGWGIADYASACHSFILVPVYDSYLPTDCEFIICHSEMVAIIVSPDHLDFISKIKNSGVSNLKYIIVIDSNVGVSNPSSIPVPPEATHLFSDIMETGKKNHVDEIIAEPDDLQTYVYTSGTTGTPKGAMLTQNNLAAGAMMISCMSFPDLEDEEKQEVCLSYLPLAHIFGRIAELVIATYGGRLPYFTGTIANLVPDIVAAKVTILCGVPRIFIKTYQKIQQTLAAQPFYKRWMFSAGYNYARSCMHKGSIPPAWVSRSIFGQIRASMGGAVRCIYNGGSSLPFPVREFLSVCFGAYIGEGYGVTETSAAITCVRPVVFDPDSVGIPYLGSEVRLESLPEMDYTITDKPYPRGEIIVRGPQVFKGYYKDEENTFRALDKDGWFHTGDVGLYQPGPFVKDDYVTPRPSLRIIDRKKNIFKLAQGEFIIADRVETTLLAGTLFAKQLIVYGPQTATALVAIVVPDWDVLLARENAAQTGSEQWGGELLKRYWANGEVPGAEGKAAGHTDGNADSEGAAVSAGQASQSSSDNTSASSPSSSPTIPSATSPSSSSAPSSSSSSTAPVPASVPVPVQKGGELLTPLALRRALLGIGPTAGPTASSTVSSASASTPTPAPASAAALALRTFFLAEFRRVCESAENRGKIRRFEIPKGVVLCELEWTDQNKCMTPSGKIRRESVKSTFHSEITAELERIERESNAAGREGQKVDSSV